MKSLFLLFIVSAACFAGTGTLIIKSRETAVLKVNGDSVGVSSVSLELPAGEYSVLAERKWYKRERLVKVNENDTTTTRPNPSFFDLKLSSFITSSFDRAPSIGASIVVTVEPVYNRFRLTGEVGLSASLYENSFPLLDQMHLVGRMEYLFSRWGIVQMGLGAHAGFPSGAQIGPTVSLEIGDQGKLFTGRICYDFGVQPIIDTEKDHISGAEFGQVLFAGILFDF